MKILVGFSTKRSFNPISLLIRKITKAEFSHSVIIFKLHETDLVFQANHNRVNLQDLEVFKREESIVKCLTAEVDKDKFFAYILPLLGIKYGLFTLFGMFLQRVGAKIGLRFKVPFKDGDDTLVCSEIIIRTLQESGNIDAICNLDPEKASPLDLYNTLARRG